MSKIGASRSRSSRASVVLGCALGLTSLGAVLMVPAAAAPRLGWTAPRVVIALHHADLRGDAMTAFRNRAYVVDLTDDHTGGKSASKIWFSTDATGKWRRELVAVVPDDPGTDGASAPQIAVVPASGHVVIAVMDATANGSRLLSFSNQSGGWQPLSLSEGEGDEAIHNESAPSLATHGNTVALGFNASYVATTNECSQQEGNVFVSLLRDGEAAWSPPRNVTHDFCQPSLFARNPLLAYDPSGTLYMLYQRSGDPNTLNQLAIRSGSLEQGTEELIEPAPATANWGLASQPGYYDLAIDSRGIPQVVYWLGSGSSTVPSRVVYAVRSAGGWRRTVLHQATKVGEDADAAQMAPVVASGDSGLIVAYTGAYNTNSNVSQAVYWMQSDGGTWSGPANVTHSKHSDTTPLLAASDGLMHLLMLREGSGYLYMHQLPYPSVAQHLANPGRVPDFTGTVSPATDPEPVHFCLQRKLSATRWGTCQGGAARTSVQGKSGSFEHRYSGLSPGDYRFRVTVGETEDHLSGGGGWTSLTVP